DLFWCTSFAVGTSIFFISTNRRPPRSTLFPCTTLFRSVFACFVESFKNPERFIAVAEQALALGKPVLVLKAGVSAKGQEVIASRSEEHTSELQSRGHLVCRLLLEKKKHIIYTLIA